MPNNKNTLYMDKPPFLTPSNDKNRLYIDTLPQGTYVNYLKSQTNNLISSIGGYDGSSDTKTEKPAAPAAPAISDVGTTPTNINIKEPDLPTATAGDTYASYNESITQALEKSRTALDDEYKKQIERINQQIDDATAKQEEYTKKLEGTLASSEVQNLTKPFREQLLQNERNRLGVEQNFQANQKLIGELDSLLTESNTLMKQIGSSKIPGLAGIQQSPRVFQRMSNVTARVGVIEAVLKARNDQITTANGMIDKSIDAINADRQDRLSYYNTLLNFYNSVRDDEGNKLITLSKDKEDYIKSQVSLLEGDMKSAQETSDYIKGLLTDPDTALFMSRAGVTLNDSVEEINKKMASQQSSDIVNEFKNTLISKGYRYTPLASGSNVETYNIGGKELKFTKPASEMSISDRKSLLELAKAGDQYAISKLGYDPNDSPLTYEKQVAYEDQLLTLDTDYSRIEKMLDDQASISASAGLIQFATPGVKNLMSLGTPSGKDRAIVGYATALNNKRDFLNNMSYIVNNLAFDKITDLKKSGVTFGSLTDSERMAIGRAADPIASAVITDASGNVTGYRGSEERLAEDLNNLMTAINRSRDRVNVEFISKNLRNEITDAYNGVNN